jgi:hypothetical protein
MLLALKSKAGSTGVLANPVKLTSLADAVGNNVKSDMSVSEVRRLYDLMRQINNSKVASAGLNDLNGANYLTSSRIHGQDILVPAAGKDNYGDIRSALSRLFSNNQIVNEGAQVVVLNATDSFGVASATKEKLVAKFVNVTSIADARATSSTSQIIDASGGQDPQTLLLLKRSFGNNVTTTNPYAARYPHASFIVLVGADHIPADLQ